MGRAEKFSSGVPSSPLFPLELEESCCAAAAAAAAAAALALALLSSLATPEQTVTKLPSLFSLSLSPASATSTSSSSDCSFFCSLFFPRARKTSFCPRGIGGGGGRGHGGRGGERKKKEGIAFFGMERIDLRERERERGRRDRMLDACLRVLTQRNSSWG